MPDSILLVDDDPVTLQTLNELFRGHGFVTETASSGEDAMATLLENDFDAVVLDVMLPGRDGLGVLRDLRERGRLTPILLLTSKSDSTDKVEGLMKGADDYVTKPFDHPELIARIEALIRRARRSPITDKVRTSGVLLDFARHEARVHGETRDLTAKEVAILRYLIVHRDRTISRKELLLEVWGYPNVDIETRTVENHIAKLRQKVEPDVGSPTIVRTVRGEGYRFGGSLD